MNRKKEALNIFNQIEKTMKEQRELQREIVAYLKEIKRRGMHLEKGYSSMASFCLANYGIAFVEHEVFCHVIEALDREVPA